MSPRVHTTPSMAGVRFPFRPINTRKGVTQTRMSATHATTPHGSRWMRWTTKNVSSGIPAYQIGRYCDHRRKTQKIEKAKTSLPMSCRLSLESALQPCGAGRTPGLANMPIAARALQDAPAQKKAPKSGLDQTGDSDI